MDSEDLALTFYFPYHEVSGVPALSSRVVNNLAHRSGKIKLYVIDYTGGATACNLVASDKITVIPFEDKKKTEVPANSILIMQAILPYSIRPELVIPDKTRIVFWSLHPDNLVPVLLPFPYLRNLQNKFFGFYIALQSLFFKTSVRRLQEFIYLCIEKKAIWFMDQSNLDKLSKYLFINVSTVDFVPVPAVPKIDGMRKQFSSNAKDGLNFCWIGRLCDFKSHILIYTIRKLSMLAKEIKLPVKYYVVGVGTFEEQVKELDVNNEYFELVMKGALQPAQLDQFILNEVDVITAMGTSALEGAKFGMPTILLDISYYPINNDYTFRWLHDTLNFDLGHDITAADTESHNETLKNMLLSLVNNFTVLSDKSYQYFMANHHIDIVCDRIIDKVRESELEFSQIDKCILRKSFLRIAYDKVRGFS